LQPVPQPRTFDRYPAVAWLERRTRLQVGIAVIIAAVFVAWKALGGLATIVLDRWWLDSVTDAPVWRNIVWARVQLVVVAVATTLLLLGGSLWLVRRRGDVPDAEVGGLVRRYRGRVGPAHMWMLLIVIAVITWKIGSAASAHWQDWMLFLHGGSVGQDVPEVGGDLGYYLFRLPFLSVVSAWLRGLLIVAAGVTLLASAAAGELRLPWSRPDRRRARPAALAQLGVLGALYAAVLALDDVFVRRPMQALSPTGSFVGAGYTELNVIIPATWVLAVLAIVSGFALVVAAVTGHWRVPLAIVAVTIVAHIIGLVALPAAVDQLVVAPAEGARQLPYVEHNLEATRRAFGLDAVTETERRLGDGIDEVDAESESAVERVPVWDVTQLAPALQVLQGRTATRITDLDLDRYHVDGELRPVMVAPRSSSRNDLPENGWVQQHLVYTHGDGVVAVPADRPDADGRPDVAALADTVTTSRPELYFGEGLDGWYAIVGTDRREQGGTSFSADTGISMSSTVERAVLSLATGEIEPLLSAELTSDSQLLYRRGIAERLAALAPWATFGGDPYPVVLDDRVVWVVDGYTTSSTFPYSQYIGFAGTSVNYLHASLKATVDAYDGTVHLYRTTIGGADDPVLDAWEDIFPGLVEPIAEVPEELAPHLRYAPELFSVQSALLGRYHVDDAETLFNGTQRWSPSAAAPTGVATGSPGASTAVSLFQPSGDVDLTGHWVSSVPFSPGAGAATSSARDRLAALAIADNDGSEHVDLIAVEPIPGRDVSTPLVAQSAIDADPRIAQQVTLLNANGSVVQFGPMTSLLFGAEAGGGEDGGVVWVRSIIVSGTAATTAPRLFGVVAVSNGLVGFGSDADAAIDDALAQRDGG
jgi:uncharacterized membrane protein (UPF0182 family)